jgi:hypothetical protein
MYQYLNGILFVCCFEGYAIDTYGLLHLRILDCAQIGQIPLLQHVYIFKRHEFLCRLRDQIALVKCFYVLPHVESCRVALVSDV